MTKQEEMLEIAARAIMLDDHCGLTIEGERILCDDPRALERQERCYCRRSAKAAIEALAIQPQRMPDRYVKTLEDLVQCLIDNDPEDDAADGGVRVIDVWRKEAERALSSTRPEPQVSVPRCPTCGDEATYQDPSGTFWDGNAHFWREPVSALTRPKCGDGK